MMIEYYKKLIRFEHWANSEIANRLAEISDTPESAARIFSHIFGAQWIWLRRLGATDVKIAVWPEIEASEHNEHNDRILSSWNAYLDDISPTDLDLSVSYTNTKGEEHINTAGEIITHVLNHSSYHRGQINRILRENGYEPTYIDYIHYVRSVLHSR